MTKYFAIVEDVQCYEVWIELPDELSEEERNDRIMDHLSEHRDTCWKSGQETIVALDKVDTP